MNQRSTTPLLEVENVSIRFGAVQALKEVSLRVHPGEVLGLLGDNGAGKSTLVKAISGVHQPNAGTIYFRGEPATIDSPEVAHELGIETVFQDLALIPNLCVAGNFFIGREKSRRLFGGMFNLLRLREMRADTAETLRALDINIPSLDATVDALSGGQRQAVAIARAMGWRADLVILDEPTAALGVQEQEKVLQLTRQLANQGVAVIYITHNIRDVMSVTDRICVLYRGENAGEVVTAESSDQEIVSLIMGSQAARKAS